MRKSCLRTELRENILAGKNSMCKGPEVGMCLAGGRNRGIEDVAEDY